MGGWSTEVDFSRGGTAQTLVRSKVGVVMEPLLKPVFEVCSHQGLERTQAQAVFESSPKSFDERDRADLTDGTEALSDAQPEQRCSKTFCRELPSIVRDEALGRAEPLHRGSEQTAHISGGRFFPEKLSDERHA